MKKPDISVIVPVYNTERYLPQCLDSILSQSFKDFEVIVVNDCSPDNSDVIMDEYASRDERVKPLYLGKNVGLGFARNAAIDKACGKYLVMVDSDDYLNQGALKTWFDAIEEFETDVVFAWFAIQEDKADGEFSIVPGFYGDMFNKRIRRTNYGESDIKHIPNCWQGIYRINFLRQNRIRFELRHREDNPFVTNLLLLTDKISVIPEPLIRYRRRYLSNSKNISIMQKEFDKRESSLMLEHVKLIAGYFCREGNVFSSLVINRRKAERFAEYSRLFLKKILPQLKNNEGLSVTQECLCEFGRVLRQAFDSEPFWHIQYFTGKQKGQGDLMLFISLLMEGRNKDALAFLHYSRLPLHKGIDLLERISDNDCRLEVRKVLFRYPLGTVEVKGWTFPPMALHIGLTKTGTTYLQNKLWLNRERLLEQGILFPATGIYREPDSSRMSGHHYFKAKSTVLGYEHLQRELHEEVKSYGKKVKRLILSCENFAYDGTDFPVGAFHDFWGDTKVKIILCVRRQDEWLRSMYMEAVTGGWARFSGGVEDYLVEQELNDTLDYLVLAHHWIKEFGRENVEVVFLGQATKEEGGLWAAFCTVAKINNYGSFLQPEKQALNEGVATRDQIEMMRLMNMLPFKDANDYLTFARLLKASFQDMTGSLKFLIQDALRTKVMDRYRESNLQLALEYLGEPADPFPPLTLNKAETCSKLPVRDFQKPFQLYNKHIRSSDTQTPPATREKSDETLYVESLIKQLNAVYNSRSWKITAPLRNAFNKLNKIKEGK